MGVTEEFEKLVNPEEIIDLSALRGKPGKEELSEMAKINREINLELRRGKPFSGISKQWLTKMLTRAYYSARAGKLSTKDEYLFEINHTENIEMLVDDILNRVYDPSRGIAFIVMEPVVREIFAAPFRDRIVHHFLYDMCANWWDTRMIYNSSSCRKGKGTLFGVQRLEHDIRSVTQNYSKPARIIKLDITGYFMSLPRVDLYKRICWGLRHQYPKGGSIYLLLKYLWKMVIFDDPVRGVKIRPPVSAWDKLPKSKSLFYQPEGFGIVIGNLSSQLLSNVYLDQLDRFVTFDLGYKHYGRYVDDFYIVVPNEQFEQALRDVKVIENYLFRRLKLKLHPKKRYIQEVKKGVPFLGMVIYPFQTVPGRRFKNNFYQAARKYSRGIRSDETIASYLGFCRHIKGDKLCRKVFESVGWDYKP